MPYLARMSFNDNGWNFPSGFVGKTDSKGSHEYEYGFGFEEWFFNKRRFKGLEGNEDCHFAYLDSLRHFDVNSDQKDDLILYTLKYTPNGTERLVVAELKKDEWRYIDFQEYEKLVTLNKKSIEVVRDELFASMPLIRPGKVIERFNQQVEGLNENNIPDPRYRLWNIEILKKDLMPIMELITSETVCPKWHINNLQMFKLWHTDTLNHKKCSK